MISSSAAAFAASVWQAKIGFYSQLPISAIAIADIGISNY